MKLNEIKFTELSLFQLKAIDNSIEELIFAEADKFLKGEPYAPSWKKDPKQYKQMLSRMVALKRDVAGYFDDQSENLYSLVNPYNPSDPFNSDSWDAENTKLSAILEKHASQAYDSGVAFLLLLSLINSDHSSTSVEAQKYLLKYAKTAADQINNTTQDRIKRQLKTSNALQEENDKIQARLQKVLDNPNRERLIAETSTLQPILDAELNAATEVGGLYKTWDGIQTDTSEICGVVIGETVRVDEEFSNGLTNPLAHLYCRCRLIYSNTRPN